MNQIILAIESSCDDCSAAIFVNGELKSHVTNTQEIHQAYGGVVPELASRKHEQHILPVVDQALAQAQVSREDLSAIGVTRGPGLLGSLIVGVSFVKGLALALDIPIIEVNHMQAHVLAHFIKDPKPNFPFLCLTVSGGHTQILVVKDYHEMEIIGETRDDAAGEAFDKTGKMLGLPYPAGPVIDKLAKKGKVIYDFPQPRIEGYGYSFSGLKTAIRYFVRDEMKKDPTFLDKHTEDLCASVQDRIVSILLSKLRKAARDLNIKEVAIAGGVSANSHLRDQFYAMAEKEGWVAHIPSFEYCTDNAAMIGISAFHKYKNGEFADQSITPEARLKF